MRFITSIVGYEISCVKQQEQSFNHNNICHFIFAGFSEEQAESLTMSLVDIITSSVLNVTDSTVSKIDQVQYVININAIN